MIQSSKRSKLIYSSGILLLINACFMYKYLPRYLNDWQSFLVALVYILLVLILVFKAGNYLKKYSSLTKTSFWILGLGFFGISLIINLNIDGQNLNIDRWSALEAGIKAILEGSYPYSAVDHLGGYTSNLPGLFIVGMPFYFLGDVGYLQSFTFLLTLILIFKKIASAEVRLIALLLFISSFWYVYEVVVKSDLISNTLLLILLSGWQFQSRFREMGFVTGLLIALVLSTRLVYAIPLILYALKPFLAQGINEKLRFCFGVGVGLILLGILAFIHTPSWEVFLEYNPFALQNKQLPLVLSVLLLLIAFPVALRIERFEQFVLASAVLCALSVTLSLLGYLIQFGFKQTIGESIFDLTYFNIFTPFVWLYLVLQLDHYQKIKATKNPA